MKNLKTLSIIGLLSFMFCFASKVSAQEGDNYTYQRTDTKTHTTYFMKLTFKGYQVEVRVKHSNARGSSQWSKQNVSYTDDHEIRYKGSSTGNEYSITYDEYNHDAVYVYNKTKNVEYKYYLSENQ